MNEPTNLDRAIWAESALFAFNAEVSTRSDGQLYDPPADVAKDLITNLCHFLHLDEHAGCMGPQEIREMLENAFRMFETEQEECK